MVLNDFELAESISTYIARAAEKLRSQKSICGAVHVFIQTNPFRKEDMQYSNGITIPLHAPSADNRVLAAAALRGLAKIFLPCFRYKKAGVILMDLRPETFLQGRLFEEEAGLRHSQAAMAALDAVNERFGRDVLHIASAGIAPRWAMRSENRTPRYTTRWDELPKAF
jgi:DNA polymerase V